MKSKLLAAAVTAAALIVPAVALGQTTVQAPTKQCSVTAFGPGFAFKPGGHIVMNYGGGTSCQGGVGSKTVTVVEQVGAAWGAVASVAALSPLTKPT